MHGRSGLALAAALLLAASCSGSRDSRRPPLYGDLGRLHRMVSTSSPEAQRYFDQGLVLYYGFNHDEAIRSFEEAARLDPGCAMAYWGKALALGPNINYPTMDEAASRAAYDAARLAVRSAASGPEIERGLAAAVARRYAWPPPADRHVLDEAYAAAMRDLWHANSGDADVGALYAEALMDLRPWDLWKPDGEPQPETPEILATLEAVMAFAPDHVGANHFYVHSCEASPHPERALASADRLRDLVPGAGHLLHMPSHIYVRLGRYDDVIKANQKAIAADLRFVARAGRHGFYTLYRAHNYHFLAYAAMFDGRKELALEAARDIVAEIPPEVVRQYPDYVESFLSVPIHVKVRFGLWDEILAEPQPPPEAKLETAFWRYGRTVALSSLSRPDEAAVELAAFEAAAAAVPASMLVGNNPASYVLGIARDMAEGELEYRRNHYDRAFELLRDGVRRDDELMYDEPWGWMQPVRHALGALLLEQGRVAEAEAVYRRDLAIHRGNGWSLLGLAECLRRSGRIAEAGDAERQLAIAWARSDIRPKVSCYCRTGG